MADWMPPQLRELDARFQRSVVELSAARGELAQEIERAREEFPPLNEEQEEELAEHYRSGGAGEAMAGLQERVDTGEFTWADIRLGKVDDDVIETYATSLQNVGPMLRAANDGEDPDEFLAARRAPDDPDSFVRERAW
ncbi:hypothetical protein GCM10029964_013750 [Kibdelosporangium lantanae]